VLCIQPQLSLEGRIDDTRVPLLRTAKVLVQSVQYPPKELSWIALLGDLEPPCTHTYDLLQELVRTDLRFEQSLVPEFLCQSGKTLQQLRLLP
jgi:hypothetical protein